MDIKKICLNDETYPELLRMIQDPPHEIFCIGDISLLDTICVAVVGSRKCTSYGKNVALNIGEKLAENEITVVSGLARGIDSFSHQGALRGMGKTISVLGCGIDLCYPKENFRLNGHFGGQECSSYFIQKKTENEYEKIIQLDEEFEKQLAKHCCFEKRNDRTNMTDFIYKF